MAHRDVRCRAHKSVAIDAKRTCHERRQGGNPKEPLILPHRNGRNCASACPNYCRRNAIFDRRACVHQIAILAIQLVRHIAACSADPAVIKPADDEHLAICKRDNFCLFINPEAQILFDGRRSTSIRHVYYHYFFC
jgi:hypothetical protein